MATKPKSPSNETAEAATIQDATEAAADAALVETPSDDEVQPVHTFQSTARPFIVKVKEDWPFGNHQSAGIVFTPGIDTVLGADRAELPELRANPFLEITEA